MENELHPVIFAGAGPGDPELITVKGKAALEKADKIIYTGSLVPEAVLKWAGPRAEKLSSASMHLDEIVESVSKGYFEGKRVVRLHTGDPSLYGAIFEQMNRLDGLNIPYNVIPGVTAAFAAAASMKMEFTLPDLAQTLILTRMAGRTPVPEKENLKSLAAHQASMAIYLSITLIDEVKAVLADSYGREASCAVVFKASQPQEKIILTTVGQISQKVKEFDIKSQAIIIVGKALDARRDHGDIASLLYDRGFAHAFREAQGKNGE